MKKNLNFKDLVSKMESLKETDLGKLKGGIRVLSALADHDGCGCNSSQCSCSNGTCKPKQA